MAVYTAAKLSRQNRDFLERRATDSGTNLTRAIEEILNEARVREEIKAEKERENREKKTK